MKLEPSNQIRLFSHKEQFESLINLYSENKLPNKILFSGEKGIGKCTLAYHIVNYILSQSEENPYDIENLQINLENKSFKLVQNKSCPNFILIDVLFEKKNIDIDQIRNLILSLNKSSFIDKPRIILIDNIELLNINSINALLKILEEPNDNIYFILINNNKKILPTLKSRCLNFKIQLNFDQSIDTINKILKDNIFDLLNIDLINYYNTPGQLLNLIDLQNQFVLNLKEMNLKDLIFFIIKNKHYKKNLTINELIYSLIEFYLRSNISVDDINLINIKDYFLKKINDVKKFNLDEEALLMEFEDKVLNG
jgi:DNA polymerase-3 subunit delta'